MKAHTAPRGDSRLQSLDALRQERLKKLQEQCKKLRHHNRRVERSLVNFADGKKAILDAHAIVRERLLAIAPAVAPGIANLSEPWAIQELLRRAIEDALNELARKFGGH